LVNDQKMGSQKLGAYEVRYKWKIQNSTSSVLNEGWRRLINNRNPSGTPLVTAGRFGGGILLSDHPR
jgi:hypothetical protein